MKRIDNRLHVVIALVVLLAGAAQFAGVAAAGHGSPANFTVYPQDTADRSPGITDATYVMSSAGADAFDSDRGLKYVDFYWLESDQARFTDCDPDSARVFGIDRGNNNSGTQTDVDLLEHMKNYDVGDSRITLELYDESDFGGDPVNLNAPDATIAVLGDCIENTGDPGWYRFTGYVNGTTYDDGYEEVYLDSHYFWIGDFENEEEAREELGPPPSEETDDTDGTDESTPEPDTPTPTPTSDDTDDSDSGEDADGTESTPEPDTPTPTPTSDDGDGGAAGGEPDGDSDGDDGESQDDAGDEEASGDDAADGTPTPGDGAGFGPVVALGALLAAALSARRR